MAAEAPRPERPIDELFVRYWDNALSGAERDELEQRLAASGADRHWFQTLALQSVAAAELSAIARLEPNPPIASVVAPAQSRRWSRRRLLRYLSAGLVAGAFAGATGLLSRGMAARTASPIRLALPRGSVELLAADGRAIAPSEQVPTGATVVTRGFNSSVTLVYPNGNNISLAGDSAMAVENDGRRLLLHQGNATASIRRQEADDTLILSTATATLTFVTGALTTLDHSTARGATEVGVLNGSVAVAGPQGQALGVFREGDLLTVRSNGDCRKQSMTKAPDEYQWDLSRPLPEGWSVGYREVRSDGPVVRPRFWFDPYHQAEMSQIRSNNQWTRGFFRLFPESLIRVRYRVQRPGASQMCICVRTARSGSPESGVLECNGAFLNARPGEWQTLEVRAGELLENAHAPDFPPPWVGFLVIFNTYKADLGLEIAEFRVARAGGAVAGQ